METVCFTIEGMDCAEEVGSLRAQLSPLAGVEDLAFDLFGGKLTVVFDGQKLSEAQIADAIRGTGMRARPFSNNVQQDGKVSGSIKWLRTGLTVFSGVLIAVAVVVDGILRGWKAAITGEGSPSPVANAIYWMAALAGAWFVLPKAWRSLRNLRPDMNLLMTIAVAGAIAIGQSFEAAAVAFLFAVSLALESWSVGRARRAIASLMELAPPTATVIKSDGTESRQPAADVVAGATLIVRPGERFPLDGRITKGETSVDQAPITGESMPVAKGPESEVFAGTINQDGAVEYITTKRAEDTTLAKIIRMVGDAQSKRSASEQWVERFARYYTPCVIVFAIMVMVIPPLVYGGAWSQWFYQALVLLVIACPCALVVSTPVSIVAGIASAAKQGVLIKGGPYLELPAGVMAIALDKTGTLTYGRPEVRSVVALDGHAEDDVLRIAATMEVRSEHPLARAVVRAAKAKGIEPTPADDVTAVRGKGVTANVDGSPIWLGSHRLLEERGQESPAMHEQLEKLASEGMSLVVVGERDHVCGFLAIADAIRPNAKAIVSSLRSAGIQHVVMLTGDNEATAQAVAKQVGVDEVKAELLPEDKVAVIEQLVTKYRHVAMVGDGVNDAPALARASLGIAMGAMGTDAALETADVALMNDDLSKLPWLIRHSRRTLTIIRQNICTALGVKLVVVCLTLAGHTSLWAAIAADMGASLVVIANGLRLLHPRK